MRVCGRFRAVGPSQAPIRPTSSDLSASLRDLRVRYVSTSAATPRAGFEQLSALPAVGHLDVWEFARGRELAGRAGANQEGSGRNWACESGSGDGRASPNSGIATHDRNGTKRRLRDLIHMWAY